MPVVLPREAWSAWLDTSQKDAEAALRFALASAYPTMPFHRVSMRVNATKNNDETLIAPFEEGCRRICCGEGPMSESSALRTKPGETQLTGDRRGCDSQPALA